MAEERTTAQKRAERNSATRGEDGHAPVLASRDPADDLPESLAKKNSARPALSEKDNTRVTGGEHLTREEAADRAKRNSATFPQPNAKPVLVNQPEDDDDLSTPAERSRSQRKAISSSPENKSAATTARK